MRTRVSGLSYGVVCVFLCLAVLVEHRLVTDRETQTQTDGQTHDHGIYRAEHSSRGKNAVILYLPSRHTASLANHPTSKAYGSADLLRSVGITT